MAEYFKYNGEVWAADDSDCVADFIRNEDLYSKISGGAVSYDVIVPSDYMVARLAAEGLIMKIDPAKNIENYQVRYFVMN